MYLDVAGFFVEAEVRAQRLPLALKALFRFQVVELEVDFKVGPRLAPKKNKTKKAGMSTKKTQARQKTTPQTEARSGGARARTRLMSNVANEKRASASGELSAAAAAAAA